MICTVSFLISESSFRTFLTKQDHTLLKDLRSRQGLKQEQTLFNDLRRRIKK